MKHGKPTKEVAEIEAVMCTMDAMGIPRATENGEYLTMKERHSIFKERSSFVNSTNNQVN